MEEKREPFTKKDLLAILADYPDDTEIGFVDGNDRTWRYCEKLSNGSSFEFEGNRSSFLDLGIEPDK